MKSLFLATAAVAAFAAAPALAQTAPTGSVGGAWVHNEADAGGLSAEGDGGVIDGNVAGPVFGDWTVTLGASLGWADGQFDEDRALSAQVHLTRKFDDLRIGGFVASNDVPGDSAITVGLEAQKYAGPLTVTGAVAVSTLEDLDVISLSGDVGYFLGDDFRLNATAGVGNLDDGTGNTRYYSLGAGGEYRFSGTPVSLFAGYDRTTIDDLDLDIDTVSVGLRFSFGADTLKAREASGADLGRTIGGFVNALSGL